MRSYTQLIRKFCVTQNKVLRFLATFTLLTMPYGSTKKNTALTLLKKIKANNLLEIQKKLTQSSHQHGS